MKVTEDSNFAMMKVTIKESISESTAMMSNNDSL